MTSQIIYVNSIYLSLLIIKVYKFNNRPNN